MLYCHIAFQPKYFHCDEHGILHNGRHFKTYFLMPIERVVLFSLVLFPLFFCSAHLKNWSLMPKPQTTQRIRCVVPCAIYDTSFCRAFMKNASMAKWRFEGGLFEFPFAFLVLSVLNSFCPFLRCF
uniref:Uncharacterized protein n=1 Tax=Rhipicephalus microplus TaxID=6941 RepID=A0A6G5AG63_RHIMP